MAEFPDIKGFSERNLKYIRQWFLYYTGEPAIGQQAVAQLTQVPWGHNLQIISKCQSVPETLYYVRSTIEYGWSRSVLTHQIESGLWQLDILPRLKPWDSFCKTAMPRRNLTLTIAG